MKKLLLFFFTLSLYACSTYQIVDIEILVPPTYQISPAVHDITLINNAKEQPSNVGHRSYKAKPSYDSHTRKKKFFKHENIKVDSTTIIALQNMYNNLEESQTLSSIEIGRTYTRPHLYYSDIDKIFQQYPGDAILFLEKLNYLDEKKHIYYAYSETEATEVKVKTTSQWLLCYNTDSIKPYRFTSRDTLYWQGTDIDRADCVIEAVWENAKKAAEEICPHWKTVNRLYYSGSGFKDARINEAIKTQKWEQAGKEWIIVYNTEKRNTKKKARMAFNMALLFEMKNDLETSMMWLGKAIEIFEEKGATNDLDVCSLYGKVLNNRLLIQEKLDQQYVD